ncbi:putative peptidoglycan binding protein [Anaerobacterium chartisolvens]|uniref:Putative peptidoglycan binding protein n=1 Tax=Anaerobacterium chartisolvens TaxID=1297424 RepID=A0A369AV62_9FIRM|nr:L,D-transpeptidase family protein [Anaerobacterium chartisolvens]RCX13209.1 putative peptidoglycan binding protein [Anaerobacterium chartisolvens]
MTRRTIVCISGAAVIILAIVHGWLGFKGTADNVSGASDGLDYLIFIEIEDKTLYLLQDGKCIKSYPISSGMSGLPSPLGCWSIVEKGDWGEGFGGRWMGLDVPWGKYGIHGTKQEGSVGSAASHGCIRMYKSDIRELYDTVALGTPVIIVNGTFGPFGRGFDDINPGDRGADVMAVQLRLKDLGYFKAKVSGIYNDDLKHAVHRFQKDKRLEVKNTITREDWLKMGFREFE